MNYRPILLLLSFALLGVTTSFAQLPEVGENDFLVSNQKGLGNPSLDEGDPEAAFNSQDNHYLLVWDGELENGSQQIFGQIIAADGSVILDDFQVSDISNNEPTARAGDVSVAYNSTTNQYIVTWRTSDSDDPQTVEGEAEIYCAIINADGSIAKASFRVSDAGGLGNTTGDPFDPTVAYNITENEYLVVWAAIDPDFSGTDNKIIGQFLDATGNEIGTDFKVDNRTIPIGTIPSIFEPIVAYNSSSNQYLVIWRGSLDLNVNPRNFEIYGQILNVDGSVAKSDFSISDIDDNDGNSERDPISFDLSYNPTNNQFLVVWTAADTDFGLVMNQNEVFGQFLSGDGTEIGVDFQISDLGEDANGDKNSATDVRVAFSPISNQYLVIWDGEDPSFEGLADGENEIFGQFLSASGVKLGSSVRISDAGGLGEEFAVPEEASVVANTQLEQFLVLWEADDTDAVGLVDEEDEIFGQFLGELAVFSSEPLPVLSLKWMLLLGISMLGVGLLLLRRL